MDDLALKTGMESEKPLAELSIQQAHDKLDDLVNGCVAIGISPTDTIIQNNTHDGINAIVKRIMKRRRIKFFVVGEWSPKHRWHYHGIVDVRNTIYDSMKTLDLLKKSLTRQIGRTQTEQIQNEPAYVDYMLKCYENPIVLDTIQPFTISSYSTNM